MNGMIRTFVDTVKLYYVLYLTKICLTMETMELSAFLVGRRNEKRTDYTFAAGVCPDESQGGGKWGQNSS